MCGNKKENREGNFGGDCAVDNSTVFNVVYTGQKALARYISMVTIRRVPRILLANQT